MTVSLIAVAVVILAIVIMDATPLKENKTQILSFMIVYSLVATSLSLGLACLVGGIKMLHKIMAVEPAGKAILSICIGIFIIGVAIYGAFAIDVPALVGPHTHPRIEALALGNGISEVRVYDYQGNVFYDQDGYEIWLVCDKNNVVKMKDGYVICSGSDYDASVETTDARLVEEDSNE